MSDFMPVVSHKIDKNKKALSVFNVLLCMYNLGKCHFLPRGGAPENWGDQVLFLRSKGGIKRFFQIKKGDHLYFLKK